MRKFLGAHFNFSWSIFDCVSHSLVWNCNETHKMITFCFIGKCNMFEGPLLHNSHKMYWLTKSSTSSSECWVTFKHFLATIYKRPEQHSRAVIKLELQAQLCSIFQIFYLFIFLCMQKCKSSNIFTVTAWLKWSIIL